MRRDELGASFQHAARSNESLRATADGADLHRARRRAATTHRFGAKRLSVGVIVCVGMGGSAVVFNNFRGRLRTCGLMGWFVCIIYTMYIHFKRSFLDVSLTV
jgi:hypothetical protein